MSRGQSDFAPALLGGAAPQITGHDKALTALVQAVICEAEKLSRFEVARACQGLRDGCAHTACRLRGFSSVSVAMVTGTPRRALRASCAPCWPMRMPAPCLA